MTKGLPGGFSSMASLRLRGVAPTLLLLVLAGCRSYEYTPTIANQAFDGPSLGTIEVRFERAEQEAPTLHSSFRRSVIDPDIGFAGTYIFMVPYPSVGIGENYSRLEFTGEAVGDGAWRFTLPRKRGWNGPQDLRLFFPRTREQGYRTFLFRYIEGEQCLNDYRIEPFDSAPLQISVRPTGKGCLLPCSPSLNDPARCSNIWR